MAAQYHTRKLTDRLTTIVKDQLEVLQSIAIDFDERAYDDQHFAAVNRFPDYGAAIRR